MTDPIADLLTRIRNASAVKHRLVVVPASNIKLAILQVMRDSGYISNFKKFDKDTENKFPVIKIALKYDAITREPAIQHIKRVSRPGLRIYKNCEELPRVLNGLGIAIVSTSKGVMSDKQARTNHVGGEVLCTIY